tara:strand:- start:119 stop:1039 length:921 start_codon:yes stop_codon:yes gene_type:complete
MRIAIIGRTEILYDAAIFLRNSGHEITCILTAKEAPEYARSLNDFMALANSWGIPFAAGSNIIEHADFLRDSNSEIAVSVNYTGIVPQSIIDLFPLGILNAHGGDLPRYRGNACQAWAILNGEDRIGCCIHKMIGGQLDNGDIILKEYLNIDQNTKITAIWDWLNETIPGLILKAIEKLSVAPHYILESQSKNPEDILRCYPRRPEDGKICWEQSAIAILRLINASNKPYAGAFCDYEGETMIVWDAEIVGDEEIFCAVPGQVIRIHRHSIDIACGRGKLRLNDVEIDGVTGAPARWIKSTRKRLN